MFMIQFTHSIYLVIRYRVELPKKVYWLFILCIFLLTSGCFVISYTPIKSIQFSSIHDISKNYLIDEEHTIILDSSFLSKVNNLFKDTIDKKNILQPLRVHYFIDEQLKSNLINCYAPGKGISKLDWESDNRFSLFPPKTHYTFKNKLNLNIFYDLTKLNKPKKSIVVLIFWSNILKKIAQNLLNWLLIN